MDLVGFGGRDGDLGGELNVDSDGYGDGEGDEYGGDDDDGDGDGGVSTLTHQIVGVVRATKDRIRRLHPHAGLGGIGHTDNNHTRGARSQIKSGVGRIRVKSQKYRSRGDGNYGWYGIIMASRRTDLSPTALPPHNRPPQRHSHRHVCPRARVHRWYMACLRLPCTPLRFSLMR